MARASYRRAARALLALGLVLVTSTACGSVGLLDDEPAPDGPPRPAGETQVITVEVGPKDNRLGAAVTTKRPGEDAELKDGRAEPVRTPTPRTSDTVGTIPSWENWPTPLPLPAVAAGADAPEKPPAGAQSRRQPTPVPTPSRPVGSAQGANTRQ